MILKADNKNFLLQLLIFVSIVAKLFLSKAGFLTEPDETLYFWSFSFLKRLAHFDFYGALDSLFSARGRPVEVLIKSVPAAIQFLSAKIFGLNIFETKNMWAIFLYNLIIYLAVLYFLYKIILIILNSKSWALTGVLFYSLIINSFVYLRHIYPYDTSLLLIVFLVYLLIKYYLEQKRISFGKSFLLGFLAFITFMIYPTNYLMFFVLFFLYVWILFKNFNPEWKYIYKQTFGYVAGSISVLIIFELLSRIVGKSYITNLVSLSGTIDQGDYNESVYFLFRYLLEVEGLSGIILIIGLLLYLLNIPSVFKNKKTQILAVLFLWISFLYLIHTVILCYGLQKMTVYIRQMHQFFPFLIIFSLTGYKYFYKSMKLKFFNHKFIQNLISLMVLFIIYNQTTEYLKIAYPRDIYWKYLRHTDKKLIKEISEYKNSWSNLPDRFLENEKISNTTDTIIAVNTQYFFPIKDISKYKVYIPPQNKKLIFEAPHFLNYKAYQYEGYSTIERENIRKMKLKIKIYK